MFMSTHNNKLTITRRFEIRFVVEGPVGLEPTTPCLKGRCSNRLSYGPIVNNWRNNSLHYPFFRLKVNQPLCLLCFPFPPLGC
jgi:hypothetical protein